MALPAYFAQPSTLDYQLPDFAKIRECDFPAAFEAAIEENRAEVATIVSNPDKPTFENTLEALERSGKTLERVCYAFWPLVSTDSTPERDKISQEVMPQLAALQSEILTNQDLVARVRAVSDSGETANLTNEQLRLIDHYLLVMRKAGAFLPENDRATLAEVTAKLSKLETEFGVLVRDGSNENSITFDSREDLAGLSESEINAAAAAADEAGHPGGFRISLVNTTIQPAMTKMTNRESRRRLFEASINRCLSGNYDTRPSIVEIASLRAQKAQLLGYPNFAAYAINDTTAGDPEAVYELMSQFIQPSVTNALAERAQLETMLHADGHEGPLEAWDWPYYAEIRMTQEHGFDQNDVRQFLVADRVLEDGVFFAAEKLFGLTFQRREDLRGAVDEVKVYEVRDGNGPRGLVTIDWFARPVKGGGAWMSCLVSQNKLLSELPVVSVCMNVPAVGAGEPVLLTTSEANTLFHEFGHALHGLLSDCEYSSLSMTSVVRDFVEYPSQLNEMWVWHPEVLANYAKHVDTGEVMPTDLADKVRAAESYGMGFYTNEITAAVMLDLKWHSFTTPEEVPSIEQVEATEERWMHELGLHVPGIYPRYRSNYFRHIFGHGYAAGYYSYLWSAVMAMDTAEWILAHGGLSTESGTALAQKVLSRGNSVEPGQSYRDLIGRDPEAAPLLRSRKLIAE